MENYNPSAIFMQKSDVTSKTPITIILFSSPWGERSSLKYGASELKVKRTALKWKIRIKIS